MPIPKGKQRSSLAARGLCGKIRIHSEMTEAEVFGGNTVCFSGGNGK